MVMQTQQQIIESKMKKDFREAACMDYLDKLYDFGAPERRALVADGYTFDNTHNIGKAMNDFVGKPANFNSLTAVWGEDIGVLIEGVDGQPYYPNAGALLVTLDRHLNVKKYAFQQTRMFAASF